MAFTLLTHKPTVPYARYTRKRVLILSLRAEFGSLGSGYVCFNVQDLPKKGAGLRKKGVRCRGALIEIPPGTNKGESVVYAEDPDGIVIEFIEKRQSYDPQRS